MAPFMSSTGLSLILSSEHKPALPKKDGMS
jgi:hypothetical protein